MVAEYRFFVGIDWATEAHQVCVIDAHCTIVTERSVVHSGAGIALAAEYLTELSGGDVASVAVSIETPHGAIVETLLERGFHVYSINPKQLDRFRDRHTVAGAKDDRRDAFVLADSLRTDRPCFRLVRADDPLVIQLREMSRVFDDLQREENQLTNRLREQIHRYYPQLLRVCSSADEPWLWELVKIAPTPKHGSRLRRQRIARLLHDHRIRRVTTDDVLAALREQPVFVAPGTVEAACSHIALLLPRLRLAHEQRKDCKREIERLLEELGSSDPADENACEHRDVQILLSLPGIGTTIAATMLAEASQPLANRDYHACRSLGGCAPVTKQSGKRKVVCMRRACNDRLQNAFYHWARVAVQNDETSKAHYARLRCHGQTHGRALRGVVDRLLAVACAMLRDGTVYDPSRRNASGVRDAA